LEKEGRQTGLTLLALSCTFIPDRDFGAGTRLGRDKPRVCSLVNDDVSASPVPINQ